jgi:hypothetical protein
VTLRVTTSDETIGTTTYPIGVNLTVTNNPQSSLLPAHSGSNGKRDVKKVPFVELFNNRLQGVVSSGSDIARVYVSYFVCRTLNYCCSTNNNRPCGGLRGSPCNHLKELLGEAVAQYGFDRVVQFLQIPGDPPQTEHAILGRAGRAHSEFAADIFSRFLSDLELLELPSSNAPIPTMAWFGGGS